MVNNSYSPLNIPLSADKPFTDYTRWRLVVNDGGRHSWKYLRTDEECTRWPQTDLDKYWLGLPLNLPSLPKPGSPLEAARNGFEFYKHLQADDGHWPGEYGGVMFLLPGLVIGSYVTGMTFTLEERLEIIRLLMNQANPVDGGWGIHVEGHSTVFGTALNYCVLRILGMSVEHPVLVKARAALHKMGGATGIPAWGKFWLSVLNVYDWDGNYPIPPEMWLLPEWLPIHPHRWWIHSRNAYIPMSYLYGLRWQTPEDDLILSLRQELYTEDYYRIDWPAHRGNTCHLDIYKDYTIVYKSVIGLVSLVQPCLDIAPIKTRALNRVYNLIVMEDENTECQTLGPVSKMINAICRYVREGPESAAYRQHDLKRADFMWIGAKGMMMTGTNGSQLWDLAFITQALTESGLAEEMANRKPLLKALGWLDRCQMTENPKHYETAYRHATKGAWPFSTKEQGYTVSDCTGEGLKAVLYLQNHLTFAPKAVSVRRLCDAVDIILGLQNSTGAYASYELIRGPLWLEVLNPAQVFGDIMTEFPYPECTTSAITALAIYRKYHPDYRAADIDNCIRSAVAYIHAAQKPHGGWFGSWGICFTYATQFALESLALVGETYQTSERSRRACEFLIGKQRVDGGWGESYKSCELDEWVEHQETQVVQTAWAALALMYARYPYAEPIEKAVKLVMDRQLPDGSWAQEAIEGVFNKNVAIAYPNYKFSFTIWMLGRADAYLKELESGRGPTATLANGH